MYEVIGWRLRWTDTAVVVRNRAPDGRWFGSEPELYAEKRGAGVDELIKRIDEAARELSLRRRIHASGPARTPTPSLPGSRARCRSSSVDLPATAIGKDYLGGSVIGSAPERQRLPALARAACSASPRARVDGLELNLLGLNFGVGPSGLKLPFFGTLGPTRTFAAAPAPEQP